MTKRKLMHSCTAITSLVNELHQRLLKRSSLAISRKRGKESRSNTINLRASWSTHKARFSSGLTWPHKHTVILRLLPQHQHWFVNRDTAIAFYTTSVTDAPVNIHFTGKRKLPRAWCHIVKQAAGEIIKLTHICGTDSLRQNKRGWEHLTHLLN